MPILFIYKVEIIITILFVSLVVNCPVSLIVYSQRVYPGTHLSEFSNLDHYPHSK